MHLLCLYHWKMTHLRCIRKRLLLENQSSAPTALLLLDNYLFAPTALLLLLDNYSSAVSTSLQLRLYSTFICIYFAYATTGKWLILIYVVVPKRFFICIFLYVCSTEIWLMYVVVRKRLRRISRYGSLLTEKRFMCTYVSAGTALLVICIYDASCT